MNVKTHLPVLLPDGRMLGTAQAVAVVESRHRRQVEAHCQPVACNRTTRVVLYDMDAAAALLAKIPRRYRTAA